MSDLTEPRMFILGLIRRFSNVEADAVSAKVTKTFPSYGDDQARKDFATILSLSKSYDDDDTIISMMSDMADGAKPEKKKKTRFQSAAKVKEQEKREKAAKAERIKELQEATNFIQQIWGYKIISAKTKAELTQEVSKEIKRGWYPYGGVGFAALGMSPVGGNQYIQAVVRFK